MVAHLCLGTLGSKNRMCDPCAVGSGMELLSPKIRATSRSTPSKGSTVFVEGSRIALSVSSQCRSCVGLQHRNRETRTN